MIWLVDALTDVNLIRTLIQEENSDWSIILQFINCNSILAYKQTKKVLIAFNIFLEIYHYPVVHKT